MSKIWNDVAWEQKSEKAYDLAEEAGDEAGMEAAREEYKQKFKPYMTEQGKEYCGVYSMAKAASDVGNEYIDVYEPYQYRDVPALLNSFKKYGIEMFTFSSSWSSAVGTAFEFIQNGCTLEGMTEINGRVKECFSDKYERIPAYIFKVN